MISPFKVAFGERGALSQNSLAKRKTIIQTLCGCTSPSSKCLVLSELLQFTPNYFFINTYSFSLDKSSSYSYPSLLKDLIFSTSVILFSAI